MADAIVKLENVFMKNDRGGQVFQDLNLTLESGRSAIITGSAGSGKTSLVELLIGRRFAESGTVTVFDRVLRKGRKRVVKKVRRKIGGVGGVFGLLPSLTVAENITLPMVLAAARKKLQQERLLKMLSEFSLLKQAGEYPPNLTRVENYLVQFARASIANQPLIIIDEPSAGL
ncbi:MAG: ATP-binding cassette domain-containing protein, partial [Candidatus Zixiibacteriota bacterium]